MPAELDREYGVCDVTADSPLSSGPVQKEAGGASNRPLPTPGLGNYKKFLRKVIKLMILVTPCQLTANKPSTPSTFWIQLE